MSEIRSDAGGVVIISQVNPSSNLQAVPDEIHNMANTTPKPITLFYKGEPEALGVTQIITGSLLLIFGVIICLIAARSLYFQDIILYSGLPFWSGLSFIISGSLSVSAAQKPTLGKVKSSLVLNIISSVIAFVVFILFAINFAITYYGYYNVKSYCFFYKQSNICEGEFNPQTVVIGMLAFILLLTILQFCITISTAVFGCKAVCRNSYTETTVIIYQTTTMNAPDNTMAAEGNAVNDG